MNLRIRNALAVAIALPALAAGGCTDTSVEPKSTITDAVIWSDPASYQQFLAKIYAGLAVTSQTGPNDPGNFNGDIKGFDEGFSSYTRLLWEAQELPTEEAVLGWGDADLQELVRGTWGASNGFMTAMYYRIFFQVTLANEFLRQTTASVLDSRGHTGAGLRAEIQQYRAEARFLRALSYWHGIDLFGHVPFVTEDNPIGGPPPSDTTRTFLYDYVVSELTAIQDSLPPANVSTYGRATRGAALMVLANLYLNAEVYTGTGRYDVAVTAAEDVINSGLYSLATNYRYNFMADNHTSPEMIFAVTQDGIHTQNWGGTTFLVHAACGAGMDNAAFRDANGHNSCWWGLRLKQQAYNFYGAGDGRTSYFFTTGQTVSVVNIGDFSNGIAAPKYTNVDRFGVPGSNGTFPDTDYPMFRLAEAYLIYAEANLRGGGGSAAQGLTYVNLLRERAFGNTTNNFASLTLDIVLAERGRELLWEGKRRTDLIRYGLFTGSTYLWEWKGNVLSGQALGDHRNLYPLPASELVANPNLTQNPGY